MQVEVESGNKIVLTRGNQLRLPITLDEAVDLVKLLPPVIAQVRAFNEDGGLAVRIAAMEKELAALRTEQGTRRAQRDKEAKEAAKIKALS